MQVCDVFGDILQASSDKQRRSVLTLVDRAKDRSKELAVVEESFGLLKLLSDFLFLLLLFNLFEF